MSSRSNLSRRSFMKASALAVAAPSIISATALGNDAVAPASERLTVGFIGMGTQCKSHWGGLGGKKDVQILAVCDVDTTRRNFAKNAIEKKYEEIERKNYGGVKDYIDYHEILARKDIDAVLIATPDHWHAAPIIDACKAGKDVYCEKPLTLTIHEAHTVIKAVRKYNRVLQTGSQQRSEGPFRALVEFIRAGSMGKITEVLVGVGPSSKPCDLKEEEMEPGLEWDRWLGQAPKRGYNSVLSPRGVHKHFPAWRSYCEYSGGGMTDWGAHHFDITQWGLGMDGSGPNEILPPEPGRKDGHGAKIIYRTTPVGDNVVVTHVNKVWEGERTVVSKDGKTTSREKVTETGGILFIGEKGRVYVNRGYAASDPGDLYVQADHKLKQTSHRDNWIECIRSREKPICDVAIGAGSATVCHLINLAYWHGRKLTWDPTTWEFPGDAEANAWRDRPQREPYARPEI